MDLELLRTFLELNRTRHFGRAAEALHLTQAAVSSRLKSLERQLDVVLFERNRHDMKLTPAGRRLIGHADRLIASWRAARQDVTLAQVGEQLVIGGSLRLWDVVLQRWLHDLRRLRPELAIIAEAQTPDYLTRRLIDGTLDVAIMLEPAQIDILQARKLADLEFILVSNRKGHTVASALAGDYVYVDWGLTFGLDHRRAFPDAPEAKTRVSHVKMALEYIISIGGSAYVPRRMVQDDLAFNLLYEVEGAPVFRRTFYATYPVRSARLERIEDSLQLIKSV